MRPLRVRASAVVRWCGRYGLVGRFGCCHECCRTRSAPVYIGATLDGPNMPVPNVRRGSEPRRALVAESGRELSTRHGRPHLAKKEAPVELRTERLLLVQGGRAGLDRRHARSRTEGGWVSV